MEIDDEYKDIIKDDINFINQYIIKDEFAEAYKIIKAIIEAHRDSNILNFDDEIIDILPKIGMFLRVINRKCKELTKNEINEWCNQLKKNNNCYDNYYLEDIVLSIN